MKTNVKEFFVNGIFRPTTCHGSGRYATNYTATGWQHNFRGEVEILKDMGLKAGRHYVVGNDAPRGGKCGDFVKLTPAGKRLAIVKSAKLAK